MKMHSLEDIKTQARKGTVEAVPLGGTITGRAHGTVVQVEETAIVVLYNPTSDSFVWLVGGEFTSEQDVLRYVHDPVEFDRKAPAKVKAKALADVSVEDTFARFDAWRAEQIPLVNRHMQTEGRAKFETIIRLNEAWLTVYTGSQGYTRIQDRIANGGGPVPIQVLHDKKKQAEQSLFDTSERFLAEFTRLELAVPA